MTENKYWLFLEDLRRSGVTNMFGAVPFLTEAFDLTDEEAKQILAEWMEKYNPEDYDEYDEEEDY